MGRIDTTADKRITDLWMVSWDGAQDIRLTYGVDTSVSNPRWSPDGKYISFLAERPGAPKVKGSQVWVLDRRGGEARQLTEVKGNLSAYEWSPDSKKLLLTIAEDVEAEAKEKEAKEDKDKEKPKPIVIDRYRFKKDIEGYISTNSRPDLLYLYDIESKKLDKLTTDKNIPGRGRSLVARWHAGRLHQQPRSRSRSHHQHRCLRRRRHAQFSGAQTHNLPRPRRRPARLEPRQQAHRLHPRQRAEV